MTEVVKRDNPDTYRYPEGWMAVSLSWSARLLKADLTRSARLVLAELLENLQPGNQVQLTQVAIAERLGMKPSNVSRAVRELEDEGVVFRLRQPGFHKAFFLNPRFGYRGSAARHDAAIRRIDRMREQQLAQ